MLTVRSTAPGFRGLSFSRTQTLELKQPAHVGRRDLQDFDDIKSAMVSPHGNDCMLLVRRPQVTPDVRAAFRIASLGSVHLVPRHSRMDFQGDMRRYVDFAAFCSFISSLETGPGAESEPSVSIFKGKGKPASESEDPKSVFGDQFDELADRAIFVSLAPEAGVAGPVSLAVRMAYELGNVKLCAQSRELGYSENAFSDGAYCYFASAYAFLFAKCYLHYLDQFDFSRGADHEAKDLAALNDLSGYYLSMLDHLESSKAVSSFEFGHILIGFDTENFDEMVNPNMLTISLASLSQFPKARK
jgi:hypothetical protein